MAISYNKLWKLLIDKKLKRIELQRGSGISGNVLSRLAKDESVSMESLEKICLFLDCDFGDIVEIIRDKNIELTENNDVRI